MVDGVNTVQNSMSAGSPTPEAATLAQPHDPGTIDEDYSWRDYFHGLNQQFEKGQTPDSVTPLRERHISIAFVSEATNRTMVALSVPVWNADQTEVIGVLARTTHLGQLLSQYEFSIAGPESVARTIALIDSHPAAVCSTIPASPVTRSSNACRGSLVGATPGRRTDREAACGFPNRQHPSGRLSRSAERH